MLLTFDIKLQDSSMIFSPESSIEKKNLYLLIISKILVLKNDAEESQNK